jgi:hypothetical protein
MSFLNMTGLGKQVKSAYTSNKLKVGVFEEHSIISTQFCIFAVTEEHEPNKMKAIITEYLGYLPVYDETSRNAGFIEAGKDNADRYLEPEETDTLKHMIFPRNQTTPYIITPVVLIERGTPVRIIQDTKSNECLGIKQEFLDLISYKELDYDIEGDPMGPDVDEKTKLAYFTNATTKLVVMTYFFSTDKTKEILDVLRLIELRESDK